MTDEPLGSHVLELQVADVVEETADARSLVFTVPDGPDDPVIPAERLTYAPGQFLTLRVPSERTGSVARCYSLCSSQFTGDPLTVTVKRTDDGYASNWLCDNAHVGMKIHVLAPSGTFVPKTLDTDFLLLAAGSGITPMMAICKSALVRGQRQGRADLRQPRRESVIFAGALRDLRPSIPTGSRSCTGWRPCRGCPTRPRWRPWPRLHAAATPTSADRGRSWRPPKRR